ncbi:hypothetical protein BC940DRAFT_138265 [Gongronella butleri]|nr:hypothetical protein BC940DRAFT_138265 [Gongronella butleri]
MRPSLLTFLLIFTLVIVLVQAKEGKGKKKLHDGKHKNKHEKHDDDDGDDDDDKHDKNDKDGGDGEHCCCTEDAEDKIDERFEQMMLIAEAKIKKAIEGHTSTSS